IGCAVGLPAAYALSRAVESILFGVKAGDVRVFAVGIVLLAAVSLAAAYPPARRAARANPGDAPRSRERRRAHTGLVSLSAVLLALAAPPAAAKTYAFESLAGLRPINVKASEATWRGRKAVRLLDEPGEKPERAAAGGHAIALLTDSSF